MSVPPRVVFVQMIKNIVNSNKAMIRVDLKYNYTYNYNKSVTICHTKIDLILSNE